MASRTVKKLRKDAINLLHDGINAVLPKNLIPKNIVLDKNILRISGIHGKSKEFNLNDYKRIFVIGAGKASASMAKEVEKTLGDKIHKGLVVTKYNFSTDLKKIKIIEAGHPLPDLNGIKASEQILNICKQAKRDDLIINLVSGGASSLLPYPANDITLSDKIKATVLLINSGATIKEINTVRKHISAIKGGRLAEYAYPATIINLIISDVIGNDLETIGSGLMVPDSSTYKNCQDILVKYKLEEKIPEAIKIYIAKGIKGLLSETPKAGNKIFKNVYSFIIGNNIIALSSILESARSKGYYSKIICDDLYGEVQESARYIFRNIENPELNVGNAQCLIFGGETEVIVKGKGKGGRNQELCLYVARLISGRMNTVFLSAGSDGIDGITEAAGAICDGQTVERAINLGIELQSFMNDNDSFNFFNKLDDLVVTGLTGTNVMDVQILLHCQTKKL